MTYVIAEPCVDIKDKACIDECPVDCIYEGERMLYINPDECVDCAACEPACPVEAIYFDENVPEEYFSYLKHNLDFFAELGSPGGASRLGVLNHDPAGVRGLPQNGH
ncbi:ferredoxin [Mycobacterium syngnathidarum]